MLRQVIELFSRHPRRLFLTDAAGAFVTAVLLLSVLQRFPAVFGMPVATVRQLAIAALLLYAYSAVCFCFTPRRWQPYLRFIAIANLLYCCATIVLMIYYFAQLRGWGIAYFTGEIIIVSAMAWVELKVSRINNEAE
jgi:hypothetical protein